VRLIKLMKERFGKHRRQIFGASQAQGGALTRMDRVDYSGVPLGSKAKEQKEAQAELRSHEPRLLLAHDIRTNGLPSWRTMSEHLLA
jgi:hypothetical protein